MADPLFDAQIGHPLFLSNLTAPTSAPAVWN